MSSVQLFGLASSTPPQAIMRSLEAGVSQAIIVQGDSTGDAFDEWVYRLGELVGAARPDVRVQYKVFDDATQKYTTWNVLNEADGERHIVFNGTRTRKVPRDAVSDITGDLELRLLVAPDDWTPSVDQVMLAHYGSSGQYAFRFYLRTSGAIQLAFSADGSANIFKSSTAAVSGVSNGEPLWLKAVLDVDNGASGYDVKFYTSPANDGVTWTQLGSTVTTATATSLHNSTADYEIGGRNDTLELFSGKIYEAQVRQGIDGPILNPQPIESWQRTNSGETNALGGSPTLYIVNGSVGGKNIAYFTDTTRNPLMLEPYEPAFYILSTSHNEGAVSGASWLGLLDSCRSAASSRLPMASFGATTQSPELSPAAQRESHERRIPQLRQWCARNNVFLLETHAAFINDSRLNSGLINADGVHPDSVDIEGRGSGRELMAQAVAGYFGV